MFADIYFVLDLLRALMVPLLWAIVIFLGIYTGV
jgi:hypothetical protein